MNLLNILLFMPQEGAEGGAGYSQLIMLGLIVVVFYMFFIRPQIRKTKEQRKYREALKKGDKIVTIGGIHGKITDVKETTFTIEISNNVNITIEKSAVAGEGGAQIQR